MFHYLIENGKYVIFANDDNSLPIEGWFQNCIMCHTITSRMRDHIYNSYPNEKILCKIFLCPDCNKKLIIQPSDTKKLINEIIQFTLTE